MPHRLKILTKFTVFVKKNLWLFIFGFLSISMSFSIGIIIGANIISRPPLVIQKESITNIKESAVKKSITKPKEFLFVASSRGKYYYPIDCSLANGLKEENLILNL